MATTIPFDPTKPLDLNVICKSPHVVGYRMWARAPGAAGWTRVADGDTVDDVPDNSTHDFPTGTRLVYWLGIGGNPLTPFRVLLLAGQEGAILPGGTLIEEGTTADSGFAVVEKELVFS